MTKDPTAILKLQAFVKYHKLQDLCRKEGRSLSSILRVASLRVYDEDVLQEPPGPSSSALRLAKEYLRLQYKATVNDPDARYQDGWWECPDQQPQLERVRRRHREQKESGITPLDEILQRIRGGPDIPMDGSSE